MGSILSASVDKGLVKWFISNHLPNDSKVCLLTTNTSLFELRKRFKIIMAYDQPKQMKKRTCLSCQGDARKKLTLFLFSILSLKENGNDVISLSTNDLTTEPIYKGIIFPHDGYLNGAISQYSPENEACYCMLPGDPGYDDFNDCHY